MEEYMREVLQNAETKLSEGDYIKFANKMKKVYEMNEEDSDSDSDSEEEEPFEIPEPQEGYYYLDYAKIWWEPPPNWNMIQVKYVLSGGNIESEYFNISEKIEIQNMNYSIKKLFKDIMKMNFLKRLTDIHKRFHFNSNKLINIEDYYEFNIQINSMNRNFTYYISNNYSDSFCLVCNYAFIAPILKSRVF